MKNSARLFVVSLTAVLILTGCVRVQMDLTLNEDDTASGTYLFAIQEGLGEELGVTDDDAASQLFGDSGEQFPGATTEPYNEDGFVGTRITFEDQPFSEMDFNSDEMSVTREGDDYVLQGVFDAATGAEGEAGDLGSLPPSAEMSLSVTFPGAIADSNGTVEGTTVTWDLADAPAELYARGSASAGGGVPTWILALVGLAIVVAAGGAAAVVIMRNRRQSADATALASDQPSEPPVYEPFAAPAETALTETTPTLPIPTDATPTEVIPTEAIPSPEAPDQTGDRQH